MIVLAGFVTFSKMDEEAVEIFVEEVLLVSWMIHGNYFTHAVPVCTVITNVLSFGILLYKCIGRNAQLIPLFRLR